MEFKKPQSIFQQIADHIRNAILASEYEEGQKIPSVRQMAAELQVNPNTMMRAYTHLQEQGTLVNRRGIGFFVAEEAQKTIRAHQRTMFLDQELPGFFDSLVRLNVDFSEVQTQFDQYKKGK